VVEQEFWIVTKLFRLTFEGERDASDVTIVTTLPTVPLIIAVTTYLPALSTVRVNAILERYFRYDIGVSL
jgi:hypothetical protein